MMHSYVGEFKNIYLTYLRIDISLDFWITSIDSGKYAKYTISKAISCGIKDLSIGDWLNSL